MNWLPDHIKWKMYSTSGWGRKSQEGKFEKIEFQRKEGGARDVTFRLKYCGVCHTDVHFADNAMANTLYPCVPGHELTGVVTQVGREVRKVVVGDHVGVGPMVDSCGGCRWCRAGEEFHCQTGHVSTYNSQPQYGNCETSTGHTMGGYSLQHTVPER